MSIGIDGYYGDIDDTMVVCRVKSRRLYVYNSYGARETGSRQHRRLASLARSMGRASGTDA